MKIKIIDDDDLRIVLLERIKNMTENEIYDYCLFALENCSSYIKYDYTKDVIIKLAVNEFERYNKEKTRLKSLREMIFNIHAQARTKDDLMKCYFRTIGHLLATAHVKQHLEVALDYWIKVANIKSASNVQESTKIRLLQISGTNL
ncbi:MAG: hypothetical protein PHZ28_05945 [Candidatus Izemoplasmatales bacterium]|nr:hypothetical protein [Candidatus Izemoplasmatales bacterium]